MTKIDRSLKEADDLELHICASALDACLEQVVAACPRMTALVWIADGDFGTFSAVRETGSRALVILPDTRERLKKLAAQIENLPELLRRTFEVEIDHLRLNRGLPRAQSPQVA